MHLILISKFEIDPDNCNSLNVEAVAYLTDAIKETDCHFIQLSTDFVFNGKDGPYRETDDPDPLSTYAVSKLNSEELIMSSGLTWSIVRTIIIYGVTDGNQRSNLVLWVKKSLEQNKEINVITDQFRIHKKFDCTLLLTEANKPLLVLITLST